VVEVDGHSFEALVPALGAARARRAERPLAVLAHTVKGRGVSYMEAGVGWHHNVPKGAEREAARRELYGDD
jgi:transketolase